MPQLGDTPEIFKYSGSMFYGAGRAGDSAEVAEEFLRLGEVSHRTRDGSHQHAPRRIYLPKEHFDKALLLYDPTAIERSVTRKPWRRDAVPWLDAVVSRPT